LLCLDFLILVYFVCHTELSQIVETLYFTFFPTIIFSDGENYLITGFQETFKVPVF
jgi:hypothetical protein